eukprot:CAMPEP_0172561060 /NCGR_PEP_ID=MMETSP1067-20121228/91440_1 /TAXON_ID=265564 ORGANISM="Thalassiosira punctigera, Strain Tpunct2005C2" /NCGR_SAMPLE_ID=MMETSP1067 /ASSEMBLY_ACC=CAM_ASM_000444 /LENGTH=107 /DNA_ID=CAMNT_0013351027 /DNA_START=162 /DNA_END=482 /DNA_ORIENTATION=+
MNLNPDVTGGGCEEVAEILENVPSDAERRAATDAPRGSRRGDGAPGFRFRRPASFTIFRSRDAACGGAQGEETDDATSIAETVESLSLTAAHCAGRAEAGGQSAGEE